MSKTGEIELTIGKTYTLNECRALLDRDMNLALDYVDKCVPGLPVPVLAAFGDAVYNLGPRIACDTKISTAARKLKAGDLKGACNELPRWDKVPILGQYVPLPGLTKRIAQREPFARLWASLRRLDVVLQTYSFCREAISNFCQFNKSDCTTSE